jgi:hypothetical protein
MFLKTNHKHPCRAEHPVVILPKLDVPIGSQGVTGESKRADISRV